MADQKDTAQAEPGTDQRDKPPQASQAEREAAVKEHDRHLANLVDFVNDHQWAVPPESRKTLGRVTKSTVLKWAAEWAWVFPTTHRSELARLMTRAGGDEPTFDTELPTKEKE